MDSRWTSTLSTFPVAPGIRSVALHLPKPWLCGREYVPSAIPLSLFHLPWLQLTEFRGSFRLSVRDGLHVLRQCPRLMRCTFDAWDVFSRGGYNARTHLRHSQLRVFQLNFDYLHITDTLGDLSSFLML
jgi:hypothetical protein